MHATVFAALVLASAGLSSAAPSPRSTPAPPQLKCDPTPSGSGEPLVLTSRADSSDKSYAAFNGQRTRFSEQILVTLAPDGSPAEPQNFHFWPCTSASLGYKGANSNGQNYGQLRPSDSPHHCVNQGTNGTLLSQKCSFVDEADRLMGQYWTVAPNGLTLSLVSHANGTQGTGYYEFSRPNTKHRKVQVDFVEGAFDDTKGYNLGFPNDF